MSGKTRPPVVASNRRQRGDGAGTDLSSSMELNGTEQSTTGRRACQAAKNRCSSGGGLLELEPPAWPDGPDLPAEPPAWLADDDLATASADSLPASAPSADCPPQREPEPAIPEPSQPASPPESASSASSADDSPDASSTLPLPVIVVTNRPMPAVTQEALAALEQRNVPPALFVRSGAVVRVRTDERGRPVIDTVTEAMLRGRMARTAMWFRAVAENEVRHIAPPEEVVRDALAFGRWPFPSLDAITESPVLRSDGSILDTPGYDPQTALYYVPAGGFALPEVPERPAAEQVRAARTLLDEAIGDFPFADEPSRANTWALLLTPVVRPAIVGNVPLALIDKPQAGTGASLLAETLALLTTGRQAAMMTAPGDDEEWRKKITGALA